MMNQNKKRGIEFYVVSAIGLTILYVLSQGPATYLINSDVTPLSVDNVLARIYWPLDELFGQMMYLDSPITNPIWKVWLAYVSWWGRLAA